MASHYRVIDNSGVNVDGETPEIGDIILLENADRLLMSGKVKEVIEKGGKFVDKEPDKIFDYGLERKAGSKKNRILSGIYFYEEHSRRLGGLNMEQYADKLAEEHIEALTQLGILKLGYHLRDQVKLREQVLTLRTSQLLATRIKQAIEKTFNEFPGQLDAELRDENNKLTQQQKRKAGLDSDLLGRAY